jgi:hypothetical protein
VRFVEGHQLLDLITLDQVPAGRARQLQQAHTRRNNAMIAALDVSVMADRYTQNTRRGVPRGGRSTTVQHEM